VDRYYSDEILGPRPRASDEVTDGVWGGIVALFNSALTTGAFGIDFADTCEDNGQPIGSDDGSVGLALRADIPNIGRWPDAGTIPDVLSALDLVQFIYAHVGKPEQLGYHQYFGHYHLSFDRSEGQNEFRGKVNRIFGRNGVAYELEYDGSIKRMAAPVLEEQLQHRLEATGDNLLDDLLETARVKFLNPDPSLRREAVEHAWDAFERLKTVMDPDKRLGASQLAEAASVGAEETAAFEAEMRTLTTIGNSFRIRHHETTTTEPSSEFLEYLFARMYALLYHMHSKVIGRLVDQPVSG
jgi:hypothetical protein